MTFEVKQDSGDSETETPTYLFTYYKEVKSKTGEKVEVLDRKEWKTKEQLINRKEVLTNQITDIQSEIDALEKF